MDLRVQKYDGEQFVKDEEQSKPLKVTLKSMIYGRMIINLQQLSIRDFQMVYPNVMLDTSLNSIQIQKR